MSLISITQLPASDLVRARAWYRDKLGFEPVAPDGSVFEPGAADPWSYVLHYDTGTVQFTLYPSRHAGGNQATAMRLVTDDFDAVHADLLAKHVEFETYDIEENFHEPAGTPYWKDGALVSPDGEKTAWFKDSEGNLLALGSCR